MTKWTNGPWHVEDPFGPESLAIVDSAKSTADWKIVASCFSDEEGEDLLPRISLKEMQANAALLAAAPELYEALETMLNAYCGYSHAEGHRGAAEFDGRHALAKARGETW